LLFPERGFQSGKRGSEKIHLLAKVNRLRKPFFQEEDERGQIGGGSLVDPEEDKEDQLKGAENLSIRMDVGILAKTRGKNNMLGVRGNDGRESIVTTTLNTVDASQASEIHNFAFFQKTAATTTTTETTETTPTATKMTTFPSSLLTSNKRPLKATLPNIIAARLAIESKRTSSKLTSTPKTATGTTTATTTTTAAATAPLLPPFAFFVRRNGKKMRLNVFGDLDGDNPALTALHKGGDIVEAYFIQPQDEPLDDIMI